MVVISEAACTASHLSFFTLLRETRSNYFGLAGKWWSTVLYTRHPLTFIVLFRGRQVIFMLFWNPLKFFCMFRKTDPNHIVHFETICVGKAHLLDGNLTRGVWTLIQVRSTTGTTHLWEVTVTGLAWLGLIRHVSWAGLPAWKVCL